jgi:hypothetical protein
MVRAAPAMKRAGIALPRQIPKGFPKAQGCEERATLGRKVKNNFNAEGVGAQLFDQTYAAILSIVYIHMERDARYLWD